MCQQYRHTIRYVIVNPTLFEIAAMTFFLILFIITIIFVLLHHIKTASITLLITLVIFLSIGSGLPLSYLLSHLESPYIKQAPIHWLKRNAIVLLGAGTVKLPKSNIVQPTVLAYSRIIMAAELYRSCKDSKQTCIIVVSGGDALKTGMPEAIVYRNTLLDLGISQADLLLEPNSLNTFRNAELASPLLKQGKFDQVLLVTSGIHLKRALLYFSHFGIKAIPIASDYLAAQFSLLPLAYNFTITDYAIHEYTGIARFHLYNLLGWNVKRTCAGSP